MTTVKGSCHCGATQFEAPAPDAAATCTCSYCDRVGAIWAYCAPDDFKLTTARDRVSTYQFGHYVGHHHHCAVCGCATYGWSPDFSTGKADFEHPKIGWNVRMAFDFDRSRLKVTALDGRNDW